MKKFSFKSISLKMLALIVSVCACVGFATLGGESVSAAEEPTFALAQTGSIRDGASAGDNYYGLRFETSVNAEWLSQNPAEKYSFGTLIFPASKLGAFNPDVSVDANKNNTDAVKFLAVNNQAVTAKLTYNASIVYDEAKAEELIKSFYGIAQPSPDQIKTVLTNLYAMDMTAVSFVQIGEDTIYTDSYTTSMIKVAARLQSNDVWADRVKEYLGQGKVKSLKTYVVDDNNIVANFDAQESSIAKIVIGNDTLVNGVDYTIADGKLLLDAETVVQKKGVYEDLYVFDSQNNLTIINVLYATDELKTAQDVEDALDYGKYDFAAAEADYANFNYAKHDGVYVLAGDIDMTGHVFNNNVDTATYSEAAYKMQDVGFYGIFDGFGHTISNATVDVKFAYLGNITAETHPNLYAAGVKSWQNHRSYGIFHNVKVGAAIRNVAFVNLIVNGETSPAYTSITGIFGKGNDGIVENVYVQVSPESTRSAAVKGLFYNNAYTSTTKNVVIDWYASDVAADYTDLTTNSLYTYGYGLLYGSLNNTTARYENIIAVGNKPLGYRGDASSSTTELESLKDDVFYYGANETDFWYKHSMYEGMEFADVVVNYKQDTSKARVLPAAIKYDTWEDLAESTDETTLTMKESFANNPYFKVVEGQVLWHDMKINKSVYTPVDYNAAESELVTNVLAGETIVKATVSGEVLTLENGGLVEENGVIKFRAKESSTDALPGVPYIDNTKDTPDQALIFVVETAETIYTFNNVSYWSALISNATEFKSFIEFDPGATRFGSNIYNKGLYKLVGDIDFSADANNGTAVILDYYGRDKADGGYIMGNTGKTGFAGVFDGDGHVLKNCNIQFTGLFGSLSSYKINGNPVILKNFAMTNVTITDNAPIFARGMYDDNVNDYVENVYIQVSSKSQMCYGLVYNPDKTFNVNNLYIEYAKDKIVAPAKYTFDADYSENGKTYITHDTHMWNTQTCNSSVLFGNVTTVSAYDSQFTNIYIASPQPVCAMQIACSSIYATFNHDATNRTHTYKGQGTDGKLIFGYASNETRSYVPVIKELKPEAAEIVAQDGFFDNTKKTAYYCNVCYRFTITEAANATCNITENCTGKFANSGPAGIWDEAAAYIWTFLNIGEGYENKAISATNGIWKFTGIKKYDTPVLMAQANNTYDSFLGEAGNSCWKVVDGKLMWNA